LIAFPSRNLEEKDEDGKNYPLQLRLRQVLLPGAREFLWGVGHRQARQAKATVEKDPKPGGRVNRTGCFLHGGRQFEGKADHQRRNNMPIVRKAPGLMSREIKLEEPVNELLEDYARFIDSNADHVVNAVLKKVLWRDQDYRKWREARRSPQAGSDKGQPDKGQPDEALGRG
jgi:hypothetical protein